MEDDYFKQWKEYLLNRRPDLSVIGEKRTRWKLGSLEASMEGDRRYRRGERR